MTHEAFRSGFHPLPGPVADEALGRAELDVPGQLFTFGNLVQPQPPGDFRSLDSPDRRALRDQSDGHTVGKAAPRAGDAP